MNNSALTIKIIKQSDSNQEISPHEIMRALEAAGYQATNIEHPYNHYSIPTILIQDERTEESNQG